MRCLLGFAIIYMAIGLFATAISKASETASGRNPSVLCCLRNGFGIVALIAVVYGACLYGLHLMGAFLK